MDKIIFTLGKFSFPVFLTTNCTLILTSDRSRQEQQNYFSKSNNHFSILPHIN
jgi:hypothetical protein